MFSTEADTPSVNRMTDRCKPCVISLQCNYGNPCNNLAFPFCSKLEFSSYSNQGLAIPSQSNFFQFHVVFGKNLAKQECIPVGCVPPACCPYLLACTAWEGGVPAWGCTWSKGMYLPGGCTCLGIYLVLGGVPAQGVYLVLGVDLVPGGCNFIPVGDVPGPGAVPAWGCTCPGGVPA